MSATRIFSVGNFGVSSWPIFPTGSVEPTQVPCSRTVWSDKVAHGIEVCERTRTFPVGNFGVSSWPSFLLAVRLHPFCSEFTAVTLSGERVRSAGAHLLVLPIAHCIAHHVSVASAFNKA